MAGLLLLNSDSLAGWKRSNDGWGQSAFHALDFALRLHKDEERLAELRALCGDRLPGLLDCPSCGDSWKLIKHLGDKVPDPPTRPDLGRETGQQGATSGPGETP